MQTNCKMIELYKLKYRIERYLQLIPYYGIIGSFQIDSILKKIQSTADVYEKAKLLDKRHQMALDYIENNLSQFRSKPFESCKPVRRDLSDKNIWVFWAQGEKSMPPLVKACYNSILQNANGHRVILIDMKNLEQYLTIAPVTLSRIGKSMSYTFFSDYLRLNLLTYYGGLYIDSTYLVTAPINENILKGPFFSIHKDIKESEFVSKSRWTGNLIYAPSKTDYMQNIRNMYCEFREHNNNPFEYFLIDYCFHYEYKHNNTFKYLIDAIPYSNSCSFKLQKHINDPFDKNLWDNWLKDTSFFKMSYKGVFKTVKNSQETFYGYILRKYAE